MKKYKKVLLLSISFVLVFVISLTSVVMAETSALGKYNYKWKEDALIHGNYRIGKSFYIPSNMKVYDFVISLKIKQSPTLVEDLSSISILVNNTMVDSITMDKLSSDGILTTKVSSHLLHDGMNSIAIKGFLKSTREKCEINDEINWVIIEKSSSLSFKYSRVDSKHIKDIFDNTYYSNGLIGETNIVLPNDLIDHNYSQATSMSALVAFVHKDKPTNINTLKYLDLYDLDKESIVIGTANQIRDFNKDLLTEKEWKIASKYGYIGLRKIGLKNHFIIITSSEDELEKLCMTLENKISLSQIEGKDYIVDSHKIINEEIFDTNPTLNILGYEDFSQIGAGIKTFDYYFIIPANKTLTTDNKLTFTYDYSSLPDIDKGYVSLAINGRDLISKRLDGDKIRDELEINIPEKYFDYTGFNITLKFNIIPTIENCVSQGYDNIWVTVDTKSSNFKIDLEDRENFSLINSQGLFQNSNGKLEGSIVVDSYMNLSMDSLCQMAAYLGGNSQGVNGLFIYQGEDKGDHNAVLTLTSSSLMETVNKDIRIPVLINGEFYQKELFVQNTPTLAAIEIMLKDNKLVIAASDRTQLNKAIKKYTEISSDKDTAILKDDEIIGLFGETQIQRDEENILTKTNYEIILALLVLLGASISILILYYKKVR